MNWPEKRKRIESILRAGDHVGYDDIIDLIEEIDRLVAPAVFVEKRCIEAKHDKPVFPECPCKCGGRLGADGRNKLNTLTFLKCTGCQCVYTAEDYRGQRFKKV